MTFDEFQKEALKTAIYPGNAAVVYPAMGLAGEAGEVANKVQKLIRDHNILDDTYIMSLSNQELHDHHEKINDLTDAICDELGDVLWFAAVLAYDVGESFDYIAEKVLLRLKDRQERGVLKGSGDNR